MVKQEQKLLELIKQQPGYFIGKMNLLGFGREKTKQVSAPVRTLQPLKGCAVANAIFVRLMVNPGTH